MNEDNKILNSFWSNFVESPWKLGLLLIFIWGIPRFILVLNANVSGSYQLVSLVFISMWISPWIFLSKFGRRKMGLKMPSNLTWLIFSIVVGIVLSSIMFLVAFYLYENTISNWFVYISNSYSEIPQPLNSSDKKIYFLIYAITSMLFSPIGEEFFYRGIVHECFATKWGDKISSYVDSLSFSITHLSHFGIIYTLGEWNFLFLPSMLWMFFLFFSCLFFSYARKKSDSILGAILAHAGFNLAMIYFIFFYII